ncbi:MAG TPA: sensor domain-containing diguanylate cyclase [Geobacteraceae bacterium]|nr:sensor domain-containing diguanylate cyclase [Geobacteraceae bacterium]
MENHSSKNKPVDLLAMLKNCLTVGGYNLTICRARENGDRGTVNLRKCGSIIKNQLCNRMVIPFLEKQIRHALGNEKLYVCRLHGGLLSFLVPFRFDSAVFCLVGEGVRENSLNIRHMEKLSRVNKMNGFEILKELMNLPIKTCKDVEEDARRIHALLLCMLEGKDFRSRCDKTRNQLNGIMRSFSKMDELQTVDDICSLSGKLLEALFDFPKMAFAIREEEHAIFRVKGVCGLPEDIGSIPEDKLAPIISTGMVKKEFKFDGIFNYLFPKIMADRVICFPLESHEELLGFVALFDGEMRQLDGYLVELILNRVASKLMQLKNERYNGQAGSLAGSLLTLTNTILSSESKEELYKNLLEAAADLVGAARGSLMLVDKSGQRLQIGFSKGMNERLAQTVKVNMGEGIAGKVASSGLPLLIDDIEKDPRIAVCKRPRFRTKSLLSMPVKLREKTIGVINLSDKKNLKSFTEADMNLLVSFANLASLMIERTLTMERYSVLEQLSITDHLTGLYNKSYLRNRLDEEINRSTRHGLNFSIIFMDLDNFKIYNDRRGHLAGDMALKKTADILNAMVRDMDILARYGGEEFCIILPDTAKSEAAVVAERIRQEIEKETFPCGEELTTGQLTASFGIASFPEDGQTFTTLIHSADMAMYRAKSEGKNRVVTRVPVHSAKFDLARGFP